MIVKNPFSTRRQVIQVYDKDDLIIFNSKEKNRKSQNTVNIKALTGKNWNQNVWSGKKDEFRDWTLTNINAEVSDHNRLIKTRKRFNF